MHLGPHAIFIWASYGIVAVVLGGLIGWLINDGRRQQALLDELEAKGITRRSAKPTRTSEAESGGN
jgi:heme exporter protein D